MLKSQVAVDEDGRFVDVAESRPGRWADLKVLKRSGLLGKLPRAKVGALADLAYVGIDDLHARVHGGDARRAAAARGVRRGTGVITGRSRGGGSWWSTASRGSAATRC